ncbi:hypothetical protein Tco_1501045 [Tanacetum coccineum]
MFQDFRYSDTTHLSRSVEVLKLKKFQERCNIKAFQEWYEHVGPEVASPQGGKVTRWRRDCAWLMISRCSRSQCQIQVQGTSSIQEVNDHYNIFTRESQEYELKTKDKASCLAQLQQISEGRRFLQRMRDEAQSSRSCLSQLNVMISELEAMNDVGELFDSLMSLRDC